MKKIAVDTAKAFLKEYNRKLHPHDHVITQTFPIGDEKKFDVQIKTKLTTEEKSVFINRVLSGCFDAHGNYRPEYVEPMVRATVLQMCTNLPVLALKNEQADGGGSMMDLEAMNDLFVALGEPHCNDTYENMSRLCREAIEWTKERLLSDNGTDAALRRLLDALTGKVESVNTDTLMQYAAELSRATKNLGEDGLLRGIVEFGQKETHGNVIDISDKVGSAE